MEMNELKSLLNEDADTEKSMELETQENVTSHNKMFMLDVSDSMDG